MYLFLAQMFAVFINTVAVGTVLDKLPSGPTSGLVPGAAGMFMGLGGVLATGPISGIIGVMLAAHLFDLEPTFAAAAQAGAATGATLSALQAIPAWSDVPGYTYLFGPRPPQDIPVVFDVIRRYGGMY